MRKLKMFLMMNWIKLAILTAVIGLAMMAVAGLNSMESFYRNMTIAQMPIQLLMVSVNAIIFVTMYLVFLRGGFAKLQSANIKGKGVNVHWDDVIGMDAPKQEAWEVVSLIKDRTRLKKIGGQILRGILMLGPPGCGKTYLAKAIATEAKIPFISISGAEFVEIFVGVGASKVRKLFKKARTLAYGYGGCIVFIDEIDSIGRKRVFSVFGGTEETNSTQNQLLAAMDGLKDKDFNVIVIAATNADESSLDDALLRPGRFDRKIYIDRPTLEEREKLLKYYMGRIKYDPAIDLGRLARKTVYKTPADISNLTKEAALIATRYKKDVVTYKEISEAIERIDMGIKHKRNMSEQERRMVAYHESGHLLVLCVLHPTNDVFKASIISRRDTLGAVYHQPKEELFTASKDKLRADIKVSLGGYVSEKLKFGTTSDGVAMDFKQIMTKAHAMVWKYGMGESGHLGDYTVIPAAQISEKIKQELNVETNHIIKECVREVEHLLKKEDALLDKLAEELLKKEELEYDEIEAIFKSFGKEPQSIN